MEREYTHVLIVDDDLLFLDDFKKKISLSFCKRSVDIKVTTISNPLDYEKKQPIDVAFVDVDMPIINGFELSKRIKENNEDCLIIFVTGNTDFIYESFEYMPFDFFSKSRIIDDYERKIKRLINCICSRYYKFSYKGKAINVSYKNIIYIERKMNDLYIVTDSEKLRERKALRTIASELSSELFAQPHRAFLVNLMHVVDLKEKSIILSNGTVISVSKKYQKDFKYKFYSYLSRKI